MAYIDIPIVADTDVLIQQALVSIGQNIPGWVPREGNLEVLLIEQFAAMVAEAANVASNVPASIFQYFGSLVGINPNTGTTASIQTTWTLASNAPSGGYQIPAGTVAGFFYNGAAYQFQTTQDETVASGTDTLSITMQAVAAGSVYNIQNLTNFNPLSTYLQLQAQDANVLSILVTATYATDTSLSYGEDPEATDVFLNRLTAELQLLAPRPITPSDYALFSQNVAGIYRAQAFDGFNPLTNRLTTADANLLTASTAASEVTSLTIGLQPWKTVGNGTASLPTISTPGTAPANYLQFTSSSSAALNGALLSAEVAAGVTTINAIVGTGSISTSVSSSNPAIIYIEDDVNGDEIVVVTGAASKAGSGGAATQVLTIASPGTVYAHSTSATVSLLQGVAVPVVASLAANTNWYQAAAVVQAGTATTATTKPYVVAVATYVDNSVQVYSSTTQSSDPLYSYTSETKTVTCTINSINPNSITALASDANVTEIYQNLKPYVTSIQMYVVFGDTETSKTHKIFYNSINQVQMDLSSLESLTKESSQYNFIPDATFSNYLYTNGGTASWTNPAGTTILPNYGIQYTGTGSALGSSLTSKSQIFNLSNVTSDTLVTSRTYTLFATIDASYADVTYGDISVNIIDASTGSTISSITPSGPIVGTFYSNFTLSSPKDVQVQVVFATGLNVQIGSSVIVSKIGVLSGSYTTLTLPTYGVKNYFWTPGGLYNPNTFNYPRNVTVIPVDQNGLSVTPSIAYTLIDYLESRREANFTVQSLNPNYVPIDIEYAVYVAPTYTSAAVQTAVSTAVRNFLSPSTWAGGSNTPAYWDGSSTTIRVMDIAAIIGNVAGVYSVVSVEIRNSYPTGGDYGTIDIVLNGVAPLPIANTITGSIYTSAKNAYSGLG